MMSVVDMELTYLARADHRLVHPADDVTGMAVVDPNGLRIGEVEDIVIDTVERRARLLSLVSGGILGLAASRALVPVEMVSKVDGRVHVARTRAQMQSLAGHGVERQASRGPRRSMDAVPANFTEVYRAFGLEPFSPGRPAVYFHYR